MTICPGFVIGPSYLKGGFAAGEFIKKILLGKIPIGHFQLPFVTVHEVARAHVNAIKYSNVGGNRFCLVNKCMWLKDVAQILKTTFDPQGFNVQADEKPTWKLKIKSWCDTDLKYELNQSPKEL